MNIKTTKIKKALTAVSFLLAYSGAQAADLDITITNLTHGIYFTPLLVSAHNADTQLYAIGGMASPALQAMAEGGAIADLETQISDAGGLSVANPAEGLLMPSASVDVEFDTGTNNNLSIVAMLLPTNDGFVGLNSWPIPETAGTYTIYLNAYDAGTEANDEIIDTANGGIPGTAGFPANPGGNGGTGATGVTDSEVNEYVHIHRGNIGDTDASGGPSDVDSRIHRWLNPVAKVTVTVN